MWQICAFGRRMTTTTAALAAAILLGSIAIARAQEVVALVDGVPITAFDVQERTKLMQMSSPKPPARKEVIDSLIDEILEIREAKNFSIEVPDSEVEKAYANVAKRLGVDSDKLTQMLKAGGASEATLKHRLRAQLAWDALIRGRYQASLEIPDSDVEAELQLHKTDVKDNVGYEYTMRPIVFIVPSGSPDAAYEARKREADALRARFDNCADGIPFARALDAVAVRDQVIKFSADLPEQSRQILDSTQVGHLTPPERTAEGVQMFAICGKRETKSDTPEKHEIRNEIFQDKFGAKAKAYLQKLRREALIEYK
ncbi:MAG: peptidylprolyl isomerase [Pseudomonadota bacterium]